MITTERMGEILRFVGSNGIHATALHYGLAVDTVRRYCNQAGGPAKKEAIVKLEAHDEKLFEKLKERYSVAELKALASGHSIDPAVLNHPVVTFEGEDITLLFVTDTHWGAKHSPIEYWRAAVKEAIAQNCTMVLHSGDLLEGMSNRPDQIYGLTHIGATAQMDYATELLKECPIPIWIIDGNHDRWMVKSNGLFAVRDIAARLQHVTFMGSDEGDVIINGSIWRLWHGEDSSSYATSYRLQKLIESWTGGTKPNVLLAGHTHKHGYFQERNVQTVSGGALCRQSAWMRSKRLANHDGFWIIRAKIREGNIVSFCPTWYPFYNS